MKYAIIAVVLLGLTGCMVLFETVEEEIAFQVRVDNRTSLDLVVKISDVTIAHGPGVSPYFDGTALDIGGEGYATGSIYVSEAGIPLIQRTTVRIDSGGVYTLIVFYDALGQEYGYRWVRE